MVAPGYVVLPMTAPRFNILTQKELTIDLSRQAMQHLVDTMTVCPWTLSAEVICELDNFRNTLQNLIERSEPKLENFDLIGE
jgi:hypothetical protein